MAASAQNTKNALLLRSLETFYKNKSHRAELLDVILQRSKLSLRVLDSLATNYSKNHTVLYGVSGPQGEREFNMYTSYKAQLKAYSKKAFDPFCRRDRIYFSVKDDATGEQVRVCTTIGQLNFFRWAIMNGVLEYATRHQRAIEKDMLAYSRGKRGATAATAPKETLKKPGRRVKAYQASRRIGGLKSAADDNRAALSDGPAEMRILVSFN